MFDFTEDQKALRRAIMALPTFKALFDGYGPIRRAYIAGKMVEEGSKAISNPWPEEGDSIWSKPK